MVDINSVWQVFIKGLNTKYPNYTYLKANLKGNLPPYPYVTIDCLTPYKQDMDVTSGTKVRSGTVLNVTEQPKMIFSFQAYSDNLAQCLQVLKDTIECIKITNKQYFRSCGIVVIKVGDIGDRTTFLETDYQYCWGFDLTIRVFDNVSTEITPVTSIEINDNVIKP